MILCADPGISARNATGLSLLNPQLKRLVAATLVRRDPKLSDLAAQNDIAQQAYRWVFQNTPDTFLRERSLQFVAEWPRVYPNEREVDPNVALLPLCGIVGHISALLGTGVSRTIYEPREWKGTGNAEAFLNRILERLDPVERKIIDAVQPAHLRHNAIEAAGLGLFYLGRLTKRRAVHV